MSKFLNNVNINGNELLNAVVHNAGTAPATNTKPGGIYFDTNLGLNKLKYYDGTNWVELSSGGAGTWQPLDADLTAIANLTGVSGFLKTNGAGTWSVDTNTYLTSSTGVVSVNGASGVITGIAVTGTGLSQFAATSSADLAGVLSDETGFSTGAKAVFSTSPAISTSITTDSSSFDLLNTTATTINFGGAATALNLGNASGTVTVAGDLVVNGTTTTISSTTITVDDKNIELGAVATPTNATADGGGITLKAGVDGDKTWNWVSSTSSWTSSEHIDLASTKVIKIAGTQVLSATEYTGNSATATTATNLAGGDAGSIPYQLSSGATVFRSIGNESDSLVVEGGKPNWTKKKHSETLSTSATSYAITHGLATADVVVSVFEVSSGEVVYADIVNTSTTTTLYFAVAPTANQYRVVILA
jgi:hypothetical protein